MKESLLRASAMQFHVHECTISCIEINIFVIMYYGDCLLKNSSKFEFYLIKAPSIYTIDN